MRPGTCSTAGAAKKTVMVRTTSLHHTLYTSCFVQLFKDIIQGQYNFAQLNRRIMLHRDTYNFFGRLKIRRDPAHAGQCRAMLSCYVLQRNAPFLGPWS